MAEVRTDQVRYALESYQNLQCMVNRLTARELHAALRLESQSNRRKVVLERLIRRLVHLREQSFRSKLQRKYFNVQERKQSSPDPH